MEIYKNKYNKYSYNFYKIFNNKLVSGNIITSKNKNKNIKIVSFTSYNSLEIDTNYSNRNYYFYFSLKKNENKKFKINDKKISKKILLKASYDFIKKILKNKIFNTK